jgi:hypothetical protein
LFVLANGVTYWVLISRLLFPLTGNAGPSGPVSHAKPLPDVQPVRDARPVKLENLFREIDAEYVDFHDELRHGGATSISAPRREASCPPQ